MFELLSKTIDRRKNNWSKERMISSQRIFNEWEKAVLNECGPKMITLAKPYSFKNKKLIITVRNSIVACEIQAKKEKIRNSINKTVGDGMKIKEVIIKVS